MTFSFEYDQIFHTSGNAVDPDSNSVMIGADCGKVLPFRSHTSLVTDHVYSCIAVVAIDNRSDRRGLWHIYAQENENDIYSDFLRKLKEQFMPENTDIYLIGGRKGWSEKVVTVLENALPQAGFTIADTALFGFDEMTAFDVAVNIEGEIYVAKYKTHVCLMRKLANEKQLRHFEDNKPADPPEGLLHLLRKPKLLDKLQF